MSRVAEERQSLGSPIFDRSRADQILAATVVILVGAAPVIFVPNAPDDVFVWPRVALIGTLVIIAAGGLTARALAAADLPVASLRVVDLALVAFVAVSVLSWMTSIDPAMSLAGEPLQYRGLAAILVIPVLFLLGRRTAEMEHGLALVTRPAIVSGVIVSTFAIAQQLGLDPWWSDLPQGRSFSTLGQPNVLGAVALMLGILSFGSLPNEAGLWRRFGLASSVMCGIAVVASGSRGAVLGAATAAIVYWARCRPRVPWRRVSLYAVAVLAVIVVVTPVRDSASRYLDRAAATLETAEGGSVAMRLDLWAVGAEMIRQRPVLGWGPDAYATVFPTVDESVLDTESKRVLDQFRPESPHNLFLEVGVNSGVIGVAVLAVLVTAALRVVWRKADKKLAATVLGVSAAYLVTSQFMTSEWMTSSLFWLVLGVGVGTRGEAENSSANSL